MRSSLSSAEAAVLAADDQRRAAMLQGDVATLDRILTDDLVHIHANGRADDKLAYLEMIARHPRAYRLVDRVHAVVRLAGDTAWMTGIVRLIIEREEKRTEAEMAYLSVWVRQNGDWRLAAYSAARVSR